MANHIIAIDPGKSGGIAFLDFMVNAVSMPETMHDLAGQLNSIASHHDLNSTVIVVEKLPRFTGASIPSSRMTPLWENYGAVQMFAAAKAIRLLLVHPENWQKHFRLGTKKQCNSKTEWKNKLKAEAQRRFPHVDVTLATSDALLIYAWAVDNGV